MPAVFPLSDPVCPFCFFLVTSGPSSCSQCYSCRTKKFVSFTTFCLVPVWLCLAWCILVGISNFFFLFALEPAKGCDLRLQDTFITVCDLDLVQVMLRQWWMSPNKHQKALQRYIWKTERMHWVLLIGSSTKNVSLIMDLANLSYALVLYHRQYWVLCIYALNSFSENFIMCPLSGEIKRVQSAVETDTESKLRSSNSSALFILPPPWGSLWGTVFLCF